MPLCADLPRRLQSLVYLLCRKSSSGDGDPPPFDVLLTTYTLFERDSADNKADRRFLRYDAVECPN
jgi:hypothetical protein